MKKLIYLLVFIITFVLLLSSCGKSLSHTPEQDSSRWVEYTTKFDGYVVNYKFPRAGKNKDYQWYVKKINLSQFQEKDYIHIVLTRYDLWRDVYHFEIDISLNKYQKGIDFSTFKQKHLESLDESNRQFNESITHRDISINNNMSLNIVFYDKKNMIRAEVYRIPLPSAYYLNIGAMYNEEFRDNPDWLASRRKIFKEFAENVKLIPPLHYQKKSSE